MQQSHYEVWLHKIQRETSAEKVPISLFQLDSDSVSTPALRRLNSEGVGQKLAGFKMLGRGIARHGHTIFHFGKEVGEVTSGGYSPTLDMAIGLGYVSEKLAVPGCQFTVDVRGKAIDAEVVDLPFYSRRRI